MWQRVAPGQRIGPYELKEELGHGGSAVVYKAFHRSRKRYVALKLIAAGYAADETFRARFRREAELFARLRHPHVLQVIESGDTGRGDSGVPGGLAYLVTEYMAGGNLADQLRQERTPKERALLALAVAEQIGSALDWAHAADVLHRDAKPSNILIAADGRLVLGDFGLARALGHG
ncbi:MAG TPA: serine/threonine-protein kinase, partial [Chloroflexota bacterium]|nr:serine/threonine-protein kinase [Chloroflexota bacterium]